jgi:hypothetical protein
MYLDLDLDKKIFITFNITCNIIILHVDLDLIAGAEDTQQGRLFFEKLEAAIVVRGGTNQRSLWLGRQIRPKDKNPNNFTPPAQLWSAGQFFPNPPSPQLSQTA